MYNFKKPQKEKSFKAKALTRLLALAVFTLLINLIPNSADACGGGGPIGGVSITISLGGGGCGGGAGIGDSLCTIVSWFTAGGIGAAIASLAVIFLGIGAFFGKVNWGMALTFTVGICAIFGSEPILASVIPGYTDGCGLAISD